MDDVSLEEAVELLHRQDSSGDAQDMSSGGDGFHHDASRSDDGTSADGDVPEQLCARSDDNVVLNDNPFADGNPRRIRQQDPAANCRGGMNVHAETVRNLVLQMKSQQLPTLVP